MAREKKPVRRENIAMVVRRSGRRKKMVDSTREGASSAASMVAGNRENESSGTTDNPITIEADIPKTTTPTGDINPPKTPVETNPDIPKTEPPVFPQIIKTPATTPPTTTLPPFPPPLPSLGRPSSITFTFPSPVFTFSTPPRAEANTEPPIDANPLRMAPPAIPRMFPPYQSWIHHPSIPPFPRNPRPRPINQPFNQTFLRNTPVPKGSVYPYPHSHFNRPTPTTQVPPVPVFETSSQPAVEPYLPPMRRPTAKTIERPSLGPTVEASRDKPFMDLNLAPEVETQVTSKNLNLGEGCSRSKTDKESGIITEDDAIEFMDPEKVYLLTWKDDEVITCVSNELKELDGQVQKDLCEKNVETESQGEMAKDDHPVDHPLTSENEKESERDVSLNGNDFINDVFDNIGFDSAGHVSEINETDQTDDLDSETNTNPSVEHSSEVNDAGTSLDHDHSIDHVSETTEEDQSGGGIDTNEEDVETTDDERPKKGKGKISKTTSKKGKSVRKRQASKDNISEEEPSKKRVKKTPKKAQKTKTKACKPPARRITRLSANASASEEHQEAGSSTSVFINRPRHANNCFSSAEARKAFEKFKDKVGHPDKGFDTNSITENAFISEVIEVHEWKKLCEVNKYYNLSLVREFYAEIGTTKTGPLLVRGQEVHISVTRINEFLDIEPPCRTDFKRYQESATLEDMQKILDLVAKPGTDWEHHENFMLRQFRAANLLPEPNVWLNFIKHSLLPTTHDTYVNVEKMLLLYCVLEGLSINVGDLVLRSIQYCARRTSGKLFFPCLMHKYLVDCGVPQFKDDVIVKREMVKKSGQ